MPANTENEHYIKKLQSGLKQQEFIYSVLANNAYHVLTPHIKATGFKMASLCYKERYELNNLAELFLLNSFLKRNDPEIETSIASYLTDEGTKMVSLIGKEDLSCYQLIDLGKGVPLDIALEEAIGRRRSIRDF